MSNRRRSSQPADSEEVDGGYGWIVVAASFLCNMVLDGIAYSFGVLLEPLEKEFKSGSASVSLVGGILAGMIMLTGPISAYGCNRFGTRITCVMGSLLSGSAIFCSSFSTNIPMLIASYGLAGGFGLGLMYVPSVVCVSQYFTTRLSLATGICVCGSGVGTFLFAPMTAQLVDMYGWRGCNRMMSVLCLLCTILGLFLVPRRRGGAREESKLHLNILKSPSFILLMLGNVPEVMGIFAIYAHLPRMASKIGLSDDKASFLISAIGISNTLGRILCGWVSDLPWFNPIVLTSLGPAIAGVLPALMLYCANYVQIIAVSILFGLCISVVPTTTSAVLVQLLGRDKLNTAFGFLTFERGLAALTGPPLAGLLYDATGQYEVSFYAAAGGLVLSGMIVMVVYFLQKKPSDARYESHPEQC